jgi:hypothetical protein
MELINSLIALQPGLFATIGALAALCTAIQGLLMAAGTLWAPAKAWASHIGVVALDLQKVLGWFAKKPANAAAKTTTITLIALCLGGCSGSFEEAAKPRFALSPTPARDATRCASLDDGHRTWGGVAKGSAVLAGASGVAVIPIPSDDKTARISVAGGAVAAAALAAASMFVSDDFATAWSRECVSP